MTVETDKTSLITLWIDRVNDFLTNKVGGKVPYRLHTEMIHDEFVLVAEDLLGHAVAEPEFDRYGDSMPPLGELELWYGKVSTARNLFRDGYDLFGTTLGPAMKNSDVATSIIQLWRHPANRFVAKQLL